MDSEKNIPELIRNINLDFYNYHLPKDKIALFPVPDRDKSKLIAADKTSGAVSHHKFYDLINLVPEGSMLVLNDTKVIAARLKMKKQSGGKVELLCVEPVSPSNDPQIAMSAKNKCIWLCIAGGKKNNVGTVLELENNIHNFKATIIDSLENERIVEFSWEPDDVSFSEILLKIGVIPLPPYIKREARENDKKSYQTVYAVNVGSVAAPTAGLHFTDNMFHELKEKNIQIQQLSLHIGPGTFKPIESDLAQHDMHSERFSVAKEVISNIKNFLNNKDNSQKLISVGTTSARTLESLYWFGVDIIKHKLQLNEYGLPLLYQWTPYLQSDNDEISIDDAFAAVINYIDENNPDNFTAYTKLFIIPGYKFKIIDSLITNFHMPKSTLILLVAAFLGDGLWKKLYAQALENDYRFLSYGDASYLY